MIALKKFVFIVSFFVTLYVIPMKASDHLARIIGGQLASIDDHPYMIAIKSNKGLCGGSLVTPTCILTAAHCVKDVPYSDILIRGGATSPWESSLEQYVLFYQFPSNYNKPYLSLDMAVVKLFQPLQGKHIATIPLNFNKVNDNETVTVSGWGSTQYGGGEIGAAQWQIF